MNLLSLLRGQMSAALAALTGKAEEYARLVRPTQEKKFGDYQANCAMPLSKEMGGKPRQTAERIVAALPQREQFSNLEVAGPGFINLRFADDFLAMQLRELLADSAGGIEPLEPRRRMVIDYSSPNVAKPMHVGHLRSTVIGDALARIHRALGWSVISDNHLGDWGLQFGMIIHGWKNHRDEAGYAANPVQELARLYRLVNQRIEGEEAAESPAEIATACRLETAKLHAGDPENTALWRRFLPPCRAALQAMYDRLGVKFDDQLGESFFNPFLAEMVRELAEKQVAVESDGALCVFFPEPSGMQDADGNVKQQYPPFVVRKGDGAFTYATTDLACIHYRVREFSPNVIVYVVDDRQSLHFQQLFAAARRLGYSVELVHVAFGKMMGRDGRPYKTRDGDVIGLESLLDEAVTRARRIVNEVQEKSEPDDRRADAERAGIAEVVGLGAVKYADLAQNRASDYVFDWNKMISLDGNTAAYLQYAYARCRSIQRKSGIASARIRQDQPTVHLDHPTERALGLSLLQFPENVELAAADYRPNLLTNYLFELANAYSAFFRDCHVLNAPSEGLRLSRLALCELTADTLRRGLDLLGISVVERM